MLPLTVRTRNRSNSEFAAPDRAVLILYGPGATTLSSEMPPPRLCAMKTPLYPPGLTDSPAER